MPVVAVAGAAMAWSAVSTVGVITAIGATIGAVGAITGNKTLSMLGAGMSLVGGVSSMMSGTPLGGGSLSEAAGKISGATGAVDDVAAAAANTTGSTAAAAPQAGVLDVAGAAMKPAAANAAPGAVGVGDLAKTFEAENMVAGAGHATDFGGSTNVPYFDGGTTLPSDTTLNGGMFGSDSTVGQLTSGKIMAQPNLMDRFLTFTQKNPTLINNASQMLGGAMQGEFNQEFLDLKKDELGMKKQRQQWGNSMPDITGMIGQAKKGA